MLCKVFFIPVSGLSTSLCNTWTLSFSFICQIVINLLHTTPDLSSKINTICLGAAISFQTMPSTAAFAIVTNNLFYLGLNYVTFKKKKKNLENQPNNKTHHQEPQNIHKISSMALLALDLLLLHGRRGSCIALVYLLQWHLHILYTVFYATW